MKNTILAWLGVATLAVSVGCVPSGGGGGGSKKEDGGVVDVGGSGGGGGGAGGAIGGSGGGQCTPACPEGRLCGPDGCGGVCGVCEGEQLCIDGACSDESCPAGTLACEGVCTELLTDADNCGNCGNACPREEGLVAECIDAECFNTCPALAGQGVNVDLSENPEHCGSCGNACPAVGGAAVCGAGACVDPCVEQGLRGCGETCVDTENDPVNCGDCGTICPGAEGGMPICAAGACGDPCQGEANCNDVCVDTDTDVNNCGGCGVRCEASQVCNGGVCACAGGGGEDLSSDVENCGECGNSCPQIEGGERACNAGNCADACGGELNECDGACVNLTEDVVNCGACGNRCDSYVVSEPPVRFWLESLASGVQAGGCLTGDCLFMVSKGYRFPNSGGMLESCEHLCGEAGALCSAQPVGLQDCLTPDGLGVPLGENAIGCTLYQGLGEPAAQAVAGCQDIIEPRHGLGGDNRVAINCVCEGSNPPLPMPDLGILIAQSGRYAGATSDHEIVVLRVVPEGGQFRIDMEQPGWVALYNAEGVELASDSELNFGPFLVADVEAGATYYVTYRSFPEHAQEISFEVDLNF